MGFALNAVSKPRMQNSRRIRAIEITGKDREFLPALSDPKFAVSGLTDKDLRQILRLTADHFLKNTRNAPQKVAGPVQTSLKETFVKSYNLHLR